MSAKIADVWFLIFRDKNFILLLACFGSIFTRSLTLLSFSPTISPSFPRSTRAESSTDPGIFTNILHSK